MSLSEALSVLSTVFSGIINIFNNTILFESSLSVYIVGAFVASCLMGVIFDIQSSDSSKPKRKEKTEE